MDEPGSAALPPIAVDFDGTLIRSDFLHEAVVGVSRWRISEIAALCRELRRGKAPFKRYLMSKIALDPTILPYNGELIEFLDGARRRGRSVGLFTASDQLVADKVAHHLDLFDVVRGSDGTTNLAGAAKARAIREAFGERFSYAGNSRIDRPIFAEAETVVLVGAVRRLKAALPAGKTVEATFPRRQGLRSWLKALRIQHWVKNALVFVAPVLGQAVSPVILAQAALLFLLLSMLASSTYILNDLLDLEADRLHPTKRLRPLAAGRVSVREGVTVAGLLLALVAALSVLLPLGAIVALLVYLCLTLTYSIVLKRMAMIDVVALASLFTLRVWAGGTLLRAPTSPWLLTFSMLFFLGLAMIKRYAELERVLRVDAELGRARGYTARDLPILLATGVGSGLSAIVIFTIYLINEQYPRHIYKYPGALWGIMPVLLIWTLRVWHLGVHGRMNEDPVVFALKDRSSQVLGVVVAVILLIAWI